MDFSILTGLFGLSFFSATIRLATPMIAAAIGEVFCERAGIINVSIEGMMLNGAFIGIVTTLETHNPWIGLLAAIISSGLFGLLHGFLSIKLQVNQVVAGIAINLFVLGGTSTLNRLMYKGERPSIESFPIISVPGLSDIPIIGPIIGNHYLLVYIIFFLVLVTHFVLFRTILGMKIRAVGENPRAAETAGINVFKIRFGATIFAGMMAGLAGGFLSLAQMNVFTDNMTAGKGWIALVIVVFGKYSPGRVAIGSLLFAAIEAISMRAQAYGVMLPYELLLLLPYLVTTLVFAGFLGGGTAPAALSKPYSKYQQS